MLIDISPFAQRLLSERVQAYLKSRSYTTMYLAAKLDRKREEVRKLLAGEIEMPVDVFLVLCREVGAMPWEFSTEFQWIQNAVQRQAA